MTLSYDDVYSYFLGYITDYNLASMQQSEAYDLMMEWLRKAAAKPFFRRLFSSMVLDDNTELITYEMENPSEDENADADFIIDVLAKGMAIEWLEPQVKSKLNIAQFFSGKEQKFYSQAGHLSEIKRLLEDSKIEQKKLIRDRCYQYNTYLKEE